MTSKRADTLWDEISDPVLNNIKVQAMEHYAGDILRAFGGLITKLVARYARFLPPHVADSERDDLKTIAQLEFIETLKIWDPKKGKDIWPIAYSRINGAMKDHIRYITKADPSRFYDWITDAASVFLSVNSLADFETQIENSLQLKLAMAALTPREQKIVSMYVVDDMTFIQIGDRMGISESQISRIYKKAVERIRKTLVPESKGGKVTE